MTERQKLLLKLSVAFLVANIRRSENTTLGVVMEACKIAGHPLGEHNPLFGMTPEELEELIVLLDKE